MPINPFSLLGKALRFRAEWAVGRMIRRGLGIPSIRGKIFGRFRIGNALQQNQLIDVAQSGVDAGALYRTIDPREYLPLSAIPVQDLQNFEDPGAPRIRMEVEGIIHPSGEVWRGFINIDEEMTWRQIQELAARRLGQIIGFYPDKFPGITPKNYSFSLGNVSQIQRGF